MNASMTKDELKIISEERRFDVDWLRVLAFFVLIGYHIGMYYVLEWDWHIKSDIQSRLLQDVMILSNQWRMSLLFFISAMALALYEIKHGSKGILKLRATRLLIPLLFGMLVIVPPQLYIELQQNIAYEGNYFQFLANYYDLNTELAPDKQSVIGLLTWNHLWFLPYLFVYSVIMLVLGPWLRKLLDSRFIQSIGLVSFVIFLIVATSIIWLNLHNKFPVTHDLVSDWYSHAKYFFVFLIGYSLVHLRNVWAEIIAKRWFLLATAIMCFSFIIADRYGVWEYLASQYPTSLLVKSFYASIITLNHWAWILALVGLAGKYLQFQNRFLRYANKAVLPWYIAHQTLIVVAAALLAQVNIHVSAEFLLILSFTLLGCFASYEIAKRTNILRLLFGLKMKEK